MVDRIGIEGDRRNIASLSGTSPSRWTVVCRSGETGPNPRIKPSIPERLFYRKMGSAERSWTGSKCLRIKDLRTFYAHPKTLTFPHSVPGVTY
jgi:hypothetical protein